MKKILNWVLTLEPKVHAMAFCGLCVLPARAQEPAKQWYDNIKFSGYGMLQYQGQDKEGEKSNTFNLRILRLILDGISAAYDKDEYCFRAEYLHSQGWGADMAGSNTIDYAKGDKAAGWFVYGIVPVVKGKLHAKARYQTYRIDKTWGSAKTSYEAGVNCFFSKGLQLNLEYARVNDRTIDNPDKHNYNLINAQLNIRF